MADHRLNFTKKALLALPPSPTGTRVTFHDSGEPGLSLRVSDKGKKQFCVFKRQRGGSPQRVTIGPFPDVSIEQARNKAKEIKAAIALHQDPLAALREQRQEMTLGQAFAWYATYHAEPAGLKTLPAMRANFARYLGSLAAAPRKKHGAMRQKSPGSVNWEQRKLSTITPAHVAELKAALTSHSGPAAANHALKLLRTIYNQIIKAGLFKGPNPAAGIGVVRISARDRFLQGDELARLFATLAQSPNTLIADYILLSIFTGARRSNVLAMRWDHVDLVRGIWRIPATKNGDPQIVQLSTPAIEVLRRRQDAGGRWVFPGRGASGHLESPKKGVAAIFRDAGIEGVRIHDLRRTLGSWQAITGSSLLVIGKSLGHKSVAATEIYARLSADPVRESIERAAAAMLATGEMKKDGLPH